MRLVFAGTPAVAVPSLLALLSSRHEVAAVVTRPDARSGRGRRPEAPPVAQQAADAGVEVLRPSRPGDADFLARLRELAPDCCPVVAYGALVPRAALDVPRHGWVNLHFSLLPAWRGAAPVQHAVMAGDEVSGATTFLLEEGLDTGPVLGAMTEPVRPRDTAGDLLDRLSLFGASLLVATLDALETGDVVPRPQPRNGVSLAPKLSVEDGRLSWDAPALAVDRRVRGCTPAPGAWTTFRGERLKVGPVEPQLRDAGQGPEPDVPLEPGLMLVSRDAVLVGTGSTPVALGQVQPAGKRLMGATDWARGVRPAPGERFEP